MLIAVCLEMDSSAVRMWCYILPNISIVLYWVSLPVICCGNNFWCESLNNGSIILSLCVGNIVHKWKINDFEQKHMKQVKNSLHCDSVCFLGGNSYYVNMFTNGAWIFMTAVGMWVMKIIHGTGLIDVILHSWFTDMMTAHFNLD
jgi:hypothetical protein